MDYQSKSFISSEFCLDEKSLTSLLSQAIVNICQEHTFYQKQLRIMGVLCLDVDSAESDIVVKINDTFNKNSASDADDILLSKEERMVEEPRRKRKRMRPQRTLTHFPGDIVEYERTLGQFSSESLSCPVILPDENEESTMSHDYGQRGDEEEGEILLSPGNNSQYDIVDGANDSVKDDININNMTYVVERQQGISSSSDEVEITNETEELCRKTASEAYARSNASFFIPQLSSILTQFLTANKQSLSGQVQLVTTDGQCQPFQVGGLQPKITTKLAAESKTSKKGNQSNISSVKHDTIKARVAEVFAAVQSAAQLEQEAKKTAAKTSPLVTTNRSRRRKRHRSLSLDVSNATAQLSPSSELLEYSMKASTALPGSLNDALSLNCFAVNRVFKCTFCGKTFNRKFCLERHERLHTGVKPYECVYCGERYIRLEDKKRHIRTFHPNKAGILEAGEVSPPYNTATSSPSPADSEEPLLPASPPCSTPSAPLLAGAIAFP